MGSLFETNYNPDVLNCLANLSNDEVFTQPDVANKMLDMLPENLWHNKSTTFLDPSCKTGVFLREIAKRLMNGLEKEFPDEHMRREHIFKNQLFGIATTELCSLLSRRSVYCSKYPNSKYSIVNFDTIEGNIRYKQIEHTWHAGKCRYCGASNKEYDREDGLEQYAYEFIHLDNIEETFPMKFDVIIGNPPYQLSDGGGTGSSAKPIYNRFVDQAKKLNPRFISMIIPARWYSGGKGLDSFRASVFKDRSFRHLVDYDNFRDVFPGVDLAGGACYFLWERDYSGDCTVSNFTQSGLISATRPLNEFEYFVRSNNAIDIVRNVQKNNSKPLSAFVSSRLPFGITTTYKPQSSGIPCYFTQRRGLEFVNPEDVSDLSNLLNKWKFLIPKAPIAGQTDFSKPVGFYYEGNTVIAKPGECCSESWLVAGAFDTESEAINFKSFILTKVVRFLLLQTVVSQNITRKNFCYIPCLAKYDITYTDDYLCKLWNLSEQDWEYINSRIHNYGENTNG